MLLPLLLLLAVEGRSFRSFSSQQSPAARQRGAAGLWHTRKVDIYRSGKERRSRSQQNCFLLSPRSSVLCRFPFLRCCQLSQMNLGHELFLPRRSVVFNAERNS